MASEASPRLKRQGSPPKQEAVITRRAISVPDGWSEVIDVLFDEHRVFSVAPERLEATRQGPPTRLVHARTCVEAQPAADC